MIVCVFQQRQLELPPPIQMCDAVSRNMLELPPPLQTVVANSLDRMSPAWPKGILCGHRSVTLRNARPTGFLQRQNPLTFLAKHRSSRKFGSTTELADAPV
jgi:hypothetical protein